MTQKTCSRGSPSLDREPLCCSPHVFKKTNIFHEICDKKSKKCSNLYFQHCSMFFCFLSQIICICVPLETVGQEQMQNLLFLFRCPEQFPLLVQDSPQYTIFLAYRKKIIQNMSLIHRQEFDFPFFSVLFSELQSQETKNPTLPRLSEISEKNWSTQVKSFSTSHF